MNWRAIFAIVRKDLKLVLQNKGVIIPIIAVPVIIFGALPWISAFVPSTVSLGNNSLDRLTALIAQMPAGLRNQLAPYSMEQQSIFFFLVYLLAPLFLIVPLMVANSIAGERERRTLEALLYSPTTDRELFIAKLLSSWLAAIVVAFSGFFLYAIMANLAAWPTIGKIFLPNWMWVVLVVWVAPAAAGLGLSTMVLISGRARGFQDAYQMGGAIVLPVLLLMFGQLTGAMYFSVGIVILIGVVLWLIDIVLIGYGSHSFKRGRLIARV